MSTLTNSSREEYLRKYLSKGDEPTKKRGKVKKSKNKVLPKKSARFTIIDNDAALPSAVGSDSDSDVPELESSIIVDERPLDVRLKDKFKTDHWQPVVAENRDLHNQSSTGRKRHDSDASSSADSDRDSRSLSQKQIDSDQSPPRKRVLSGDDLSPIRRHPQGDGGDLSPPRRQRRDSDQSPPRQQRRDSDHSPPRRQRRDSDQSPPRRQRRDSDQSPVRQKRQNADDLSPQRLSSTGTARPDKTLAGATAGLQSAAQLREEAAKLRQQEDKQFASVNAAFSGRGANAVVRHGVKGDKAKQKEMKDEERKKRQAEREEKYKVWNKGVAQLKQREEKLEDALHEIEKPLARYEHDDDMNAMLRAQDHKEDPMFAYIQNKRTRQGGAASKMPKYKGAPPPPNRYGISPGYRWDGVDRSNGFENKLLSRNNDQMANKDELYKWNYAHWD